MSQSSRIHRSGSGSGVNVGVVSGMIPASSSSPGKLEQQQQQTGNLQSKQTTSATTKVISNSLSSSSSSSSSTSTSKSSSSSSSSDLKFEDLEVLKTIGTGTFARVCLCRIRNPSKAARIAQKAALNHHQHNNINNNGSGATPAGSALPPASTNKYFALKILSMHDVIRLKQVEHVKSEKNILSEVNHPFLVDLVWAAKDSRTFLYMLFPYVCGGELFSYLRSAGRFSAAASIFYASEIVSALDYLHSLSIVYRDLKPENLLLDKDGHLKITDFGFAKRISDRTWTLCGTPEYLAPEIIQSKGHNKAVDWWALGILIFEMLAGYPPFFDDNPFGIYEKILSGKIDWPRQIEPVVKDLIKKLLVQDRTKRLGSMKGGAEDVKRHRWFKNVDWDDVYAKKLKPPIVPNVGHEGDARNYDDYPETDWRKVPPVSDRELRAFEEF